MAFYQARRRSADRNDRRSGLLFFMPFAAQADPGLIPNTEAQILDLANVERLARGIRPLAHDPRLGQVARESAYGWPTRATSTTWTFSRPASSATRRAAKT